VLNVGSFHIYEKDIPKIGGPYQISEAKHNWKPCDKPSVAARICCAAERNYAMVHDPKLLDSVAPFAGTMLVDCLLACVSKFSEGSVFFTSKLMEEAYACSRRS
jgi:hypothetical protein